MSSACFPLAGSSQTLNQITKVRLPSGQEVAIVDWSYRPLYSTLLTLSGWTDQELSWFTYSRGDLIACSANLITAGGQFNSTISATNLASASEMDALEEYLVYAMSLEMYQITFSGGVYGLVAGGPIPNGPNVATLQQLIVELEVSEKAYYQASAGWFTTGFGAYLVAANTAGAVRTYANNGLPSAEAIDASPVPVHIGGTEKYRGILYNEGGAAINYKDDANANVATTVMSLRLNFRGLHKRPTA